MAPMLIDPDKYVLVGTAAKIAGVTRAYIRRLIHEHRLPGVILDGIFIVRREDAEAMRKARVKKPPDGKT
jgi:excisionase family DNA binding protein